MPKHGHKDPNYGEKRPLVLPALLPRPGAEAGSPDERLVVQVPDGDVAVAAAGEADFGVGADGQGIAGGGGGGQLGLDAGRGGSQVPDGERARLPSHDQRAAVGEKFAGADVVISVLEGGRDVSGRAENDSPP